MNKLGRNELCNCGSGKKYKKCCLAKHSSSHSAEIVDFAWSKLRQTESEVIDQHLKPYLMDKLPEEVLVPAMMEFTYNMPEELDYELIMERLFMPWLLFNYVSEGDDEIINPVKFHGQFDSQKTISQNYIMSYGKNLSNGIIRFIEAMNQTYYSFYVVQEVELNKSLVVKDILLGTVHTAKEKLGTHTLKVGKIIFGRILTLDYQSIFVGMAPYLIPATFQLKLLDYKKELVEENGGKELSPELLREHSVEEFISYFFEIMEEYFKTPSIKLHNTDDDPIIFSKSYFKTNISPAEALEKLLPLTLSEDLDEYLSEAERNEAGNITKIEFPWLKKGNKKHKVWENTIMGHIVVEAGMLILETNSEERTAQGIKLLNKHLGNKIIFQQTLLETPEQKLKLESDDDNYDQDKDEFLQQPEVQEQLKQIAAAHWQSWFDEKIPALGNKTPRQAAKTKDGQERLEALFSHYEYRNSNSDKKNLFEADIIYLKKELGLLSS
jgi:hypothetical protein